MREEHVVTAASSRSRPTTQLEKPHWRVSFGFWTELDALYHSYPPPPKPRCPALPLDAATEWNKRLVPDDIERFMGNPAAAACLRAVVSNTEAKSGPVFTNFIISGGRSTGKSTFAGILRKTLLTVTSEQPCRFATLNASEFVDKLLPRKLEDAVRRLDASKTGTVSFLTIECFESVTPSVQQHFFVPLLAEANLKKIFVILLKLGRCRYAHPLDLHTIDTTAMIPRCRVHTLPLPCLHCANAEQLKLDARKEFAACESLKRELLRNRQALAGLETQRYVIARDRGKTAKWGDAKKLADEQLARVDAALNSAKINIKHQEQELSSHQDALENLHEAIAHGRSRGLGKGHGQIELKQEEKQRNKAATVAV
ncbi:hypothetical protein PRNP1_013608 [Phytophthora ramorum]